MSDFDYESLIVDIPDYPKPGVTFKDITPLLDDPRGFASLVDTLADRFMDAGVTKVLGAEARGFIIAPQLLIAWEPALCRYANRASSPAKYCASHLIWSMVTMNCKFTKMR